MTKRFLKKQQVFTKRCGGPAGVEFEKEVTAALAGVDASEVDEIQVEITVHRFEEIPEPVVVTPEPKPLEELEGEEVTVVTDGELTDEEPFS